ncbi:MAG TPA: RagB/SusD family nutrient uptake outer membrane protein [Chitinophagaceae bacterium]
MKLKKIYILPVLMALTITSSCKRELLDASPTTQIIESEAFDTPERILGQINGLYASIKSGQYLGGRYIVYNEIRGDEFLNELTNGVTGLQTWNHTLGTNTAEVVNLWNAGYYAINSANLFLDGMQAKGNTVAGDALAKNYNGEARFIRGLVYFHLLQLYARPYWDGNGAKEGLPLRLTGNKGPGANDLKRSTVAEVYAQILSDLTFAEQNLPLNYSTAILNVTRAHRNTAIALKTRVYLAMQQYANVITEANKIVSASAPFTATTGVQHKLEADITNVFKSPYTTLESIFSMPFTANNLPGTQNALAHYFAPSATQFAVPAVGNGEYSIKTTGILADGGWKLTDKRRSFIWTHPTNSKRYLIKYQTGPAQTDNVPVIRYAEVLLNLAEALARNTNSVDARAVELLNAVRQRSDPTTTFTVASFPTVQDLISAILIERRIELIGEGFRSPDLLRLGLTIPGKGNVNAINPTQSEYIWPISAQELLNNKLMTPNP